MTAATTATKIVPVSVSIKANETERQQERRKNSYQFQNSEREKETWSELEPTYKSSEYTKIVVEDLFSKKTSDWCGDRMVGAKEYLDSICPQRGNARRVPLGQVRVERRFILEQLPHVFVALALSRIQALALPSNKQ